MITEKIILNVFPRDTTLVNAIQGEVNSRFLEITLMENSKFVNLNNRTVQIYMEKPDGNIIYNDVEILDADLGKVVICLTSEMSAVAGVISKIEVRVTGPQGSTLKFKGLTLIILNGLSDNAVESSSEFTALQETMGSVMKINNHISSTENPHKITAQQVGALPNTTFIPNKVSDLQNDSGFLTDYSETDPTVPPWAKAESKPVYTAQEVGALPNTTFIPNKVSDLQNDSGFLTDYSETDPTVPPWAKAESKPVYTAQEVGAVPNTRTINSKSLSNDINLTPADINMEIQTGNIIWESNITNTSNSYIKKMGNMVMLYLHIQSSSNFTSTPRPVCTLPSGFNPISGMVHGAFISTGLWNFKSSAYCYIGAGGAVSIADFNSNGCSCCYISTIFITG